MLTDAVLGSPVTIGFPGNTKVRFQQINRATGEFGSVQNELLGPPFSRFGDQVHSVDLVPSVVFGSGPYAEAGMGQEVLIAAPNDSAVHLAVPYFLGGPNTSRQQYTWQSSQTYTYGVPDNEARISFASPPTQPTYQAPWVAVGFAHMAEVHILTPESSWSGKEPPTLTYLDGVSSSGLGRLGWSMVVADFNGDGLPDLAVGAPGPIDGTEAGSVHVYPGCNSGCAGPIDFSDPEVIHHVSGQLGDRFGASLAAGRIGGGAELSLVIGAPGWNNGTAVDAGSVCWVDLTGSSPQRQCAPNPMPESHAAGDRFGESVAVANVSSSDRFGLFDTAFAEIEELIVSAPHSVGPLPPVYGMPYTPASSDPGVVYVFRSNAGTGPVISSFPGDATQAYLEVLRPPSALSSGGFGTSLAVGDAQGTPLPNQRPDLLIGDEAFRRVYLTQQQADSGFDDDRMGQFHDLHGRPWRVFQDQDDRVGFVSLTSFTEEIYDDSDDLCMEIDFVDNHLHFPSVPVSVGESDVERCFELESTNVQLHFSHSDSPFPLWQIQLDPMGCAVSAHSIELMNRVELSCEP